MRIGQLAAVTLALCAAACSFERTPTEKPRTAQRTAVKPKRDPACDETSSAGQCLRYDVSLIALIARPADFDGKPVRVTGFVNLEFEGNGMYLSREDYAHRITKNALWIDPPDSLHFAQNFKPGYMMVEATFDAGRTGHLGAFSGSLTNVTRFGY